MQFEEDPFAKNAQGIAKIHHEVLLLVEFLQTKPHVKSMSINYYGWYYSVIRDLVDKENDEKYEIADDFFHDFYHI